MGPFLSFFPYRSAFPSALEGPQASVSRPCLRSMACHVPLLRLAWDTAMATGDMPAQRSEGTGQAGLGVQTHSPLSGTPAFRGWGLVGKRLPDLPHAASSYRTPHWFVSTLVAKQTEGLRSFTSNGIFFGWIVNEEGDQRTMWWLVTSGIRGWELAGKENGGP